MTLVDRLRSVTVRPEDVRLLRDEAAARIEALEAALREPTEKFAHMGVVHEAWCGKPLLGGCHCMLSEWHEWRSRVRDLLKYQDTGHSPSGGLTMSEPRWRVTEHLEDSDVPYHIGPNCDGQCVGHVHMLRDAELIVRAVNAYNEREAAAEAMGRYIESAKPDPAKAERVERARRAYRESGQ